MVAAGAVDDAAQAGPDDGRLACALSCRASVRMESAVVSGWQLVFQPVLLAAAFCVWRLARARRGKRAPLNSDVAGRALFLDRLPGFFACGYDGMTFPRVREHIPDLAGRRLPASR